MKLLDWHSLHTCVFCGTGIDESVTCSACPSCLEKWRRECAEYENEKILLPLGCRTHTFLGGYISEKYGAEGSPSIGSSSMCRELVLSLKETRRPNAINFLAWEMSKKLAEKGLDFTRDSFICGVPRSPKKITEYGFDQSELISRAVAEYTGIEYIPALTYVGKGLSQKALNAEDRFINAGGSYGIDEGYTGYIALKRCILIDDVLTTAATVQACAALLLENGVRAVDALTAAKTFGNR